MGLRCRIIFDEFEDALSINFRAALVNDRVADLTNEYEEASWSVVVGTVLPDKEDGVHDGYEKLSNLWELLWLVHKVDEPILKGSQKFEIFGGLNSGHWHFLLKLWESRGLCGLILLKELKHFLDALRI